jgi:hypothetical protein
VIAHHALLSWFGGQFGWCEVVVDGGAVVGQCLDERVKRPIGGASPTCSLLASPGRQATGRAFDTRLWRGTMEAWPWLFHRQSLFIFLARCCRISCRKAYRRN